MLNLTKLLPAEIKHLNNAQSLQHNRQNDQFANLKLKVTHNSKKSRKLQFESPPPLKNQHKYEPDVGVTRQGCLNKYKMIQQAMLNSLEMTTTNIKSQQINRCLKKEPKKLYN